MRTNKRVRRIFPVIHLDNLEHRQLLTTMCPDPGIQDVAIVSDCDCDCMDHMDDMVDGDLELAGMTRAAIEDQARLEWQGAIAREATGGNDASLRLVALPEVTSLAIVDGAWSDPDTWLGRSVPAAGANVWVMPGRVVTVDGVFDAALRTIRVDGTLRFAPDVDTALKVDTMIVGMGGELEIGTASTPISSDHKSTITFADPGPIDRNWDPYGLSRGLISMGRIDVHGADTTGHVALAKAPRAKDTALVLASPPTNWRVGDRIVLTGTSYGQDEVLTIRGISGSTVSVAPLAYSHVPPTTADPSVAARLKVYVANLDRNVRFQSEHPDTIDRRGHFMAMHGADVMISDAGFYGMGRTDKSKIVNDPVVDASGHLVPGTGTNPRGRYAVHFHRLGSSYEGDEATIMGSVVEGSPGWGIVNHSSRVDVADNTVYDAYGSAFVTEAGNETGEFRDNIAIRSTGSPDARGRGQAIGDFGINGHGFWFQGPYVSVTNNIVSGQKDAAYTYYTEAVVEGGTLISFPSSQLADPTAAGGAATVPTGLLPIAKFSGNEAFASKDGINIFFHNIAFDGPIASSVVADSTFWNLSRQGAYIAYGRNVTFRDFRVIGPIGAGINMDSAPSNMAFEDLYLDGPAVGVYMPTFGENRVARGYYNNPGAAFQVRQVVSLFKTGRTIAIDGARFGPQTTTRVRMVFDPTSVAQTHALGTFGRDLVTLDGARIYFKEQHPDAVLNLPWLPASLAGKTNGEIFQLYGIAIGGALAPQDAAKTAGIDGLVGGSSNVSATTPMSQLLEAKVLPKDAALGIYTLYSDNGAGGRTIETVTLAKGWNLLKRTVNGRPSTMLVFAS